MLDATSGRDTSESLRAWQRLFQDGGSPEPFPSNHFSMTSFKHFFTSLEQSTSMDLTSWWGSPNTSPRSDHLRTLYNSHQPWPQYAWTVLINPPKRLQDPAQNTTSTSLIKVNLNSVSPSIYLGIMQVATLSTCRPNLVLPANATSKLQPLDLEVKYVLTKIDECDIANDVTNLVNSIRWVKPEKRLDGYCQEDLFWKQMNIWSFRVSLMIQWVVGTVVC